jgi:competence protein ComEA
MKIKINNKDKITLSILILLIILTKFGISVKQKNMNINIDNNQSEIELEVNSLYKVHIDGEVMNPNVYEITEGDRLDVLIKLAGGLTENADTSRINLARILEDGLKVYIPSIVENKPTIESGNKLTLTDFNQLTKEELMKIDGIGEVIASNIIEYKNNNGIFKKISELLNVNGIGEKKLESIKNMIY